MCNLIGLNVTCSNFLGGSYMNSKQIDSRLIGQAIKALRVREHLTQAELADRIGYSVRNLRRIENNGTTNIDTVNVFAEMFDVSALDILNGCFLFNYRSLSLFQKVLYI